MGKIHSLSDTLINKIAAGEVIERPVYVVKELLDNAIDAKATSIRIDIEESGLKKISVIDDGEGIQKDDIQICFLRHTTSKIKTEQDLFAIRTMGFRGEALASISAVSTVTIQSRPESEISGISIELEQGQLKDISPLGMSQGTVIEVKNLFNSIPARKKFLKHPNVEYRLITDLITRYALAHPHIKFFFTNNKKNVILTPKNQDRSERIYQLLGQTLYHQLLPISHQDTYIEFSGFISKPQLSTSSLKKNYIFINGRAIKNNLISSIIKETYGTLLEPNRYPVFLLFFSIPAEMIDVNIDPRKETLSFADERIVENALREAVAHTLQKNNLTFQDLRWNKSHRIEYPETLSKTSLVRDGSTETYAATLLKNEVSELLTVQKPNYQQINQTLQTHDLYIVVETDQGIQIIDQHAAHERILYEDFMSVFKKQRKLSEVFELPETLLLTVSPAEADAIQHNNELLNSFGFELLEFTQNTFKLETVPFIFKDRDIHELIQEIINDLVENNSLKDIDIRTERMISYLACRTAIRDHEFVEFD